MQKYEDNIASQLDGGALVPLSGVTVTVTDQSTKLPAALYSDNGVTLITAPIVTDDSGHFAFYAADGRYTVTFTSPRIITFTRDVILEDPKDNPYATLAQLAAPTGSTNIGNGTETVADSFNALQLADYTALRAYGGPRKSVYVIASGIAGMFVRDDSDTTTADNSGTVIMASNGKRWKRPINGLIDAAWFGVSSLANMQSAINAGSVAIKAGTTYNISGGEIVIPSDRKIIVEKGATLSCADVRWSAYNVNNVEWQVDGTINCTSLNAAPAKTGWPNTAAGTQNGNERGFIEFGGSDTTSASVSGFKVHGSGKIVGPWTGTPNFSDGVNQVNKKGIAVWNAKNVYIGGIEILGFEGEQVYVYANTPDCTNIVFERINSHHCRFNSLNFNVSNAVYAGAYRGLRIVGCLTDTSYAGIEASAGVIEDNYCRAATNYGIWTGAGAGRGPLRIKQNTVEDCNAQSFVISFSSVITDVEVKDNKAINSGTDAFAFNNLGKFEVVNNTSRGHGRIAGGKSFAFTNCTQGWIDRNITYDPGVNSSGNLTSVTSTLTFGSNPVIAAGGTLVTANGNFVGIGGQYAATLTYGNRENQFTVWSSDFGATGAGAEYVFKNGSGGNTIYAAISGKGSTYDANGSTGGVVIATKKANTSQALPTATAEFNDQGDTILSGKLSVSDVALIRNNSTMTNNPGAGAGTITNCPRAGNPTKWIGVWDNGTWRYIPTWEF